MPYRYQGIRPRGSRECPCCRQYVVEVGAAMCRACLDRLYRAPPGGERAPQRLMEARIAYYRDRAERGLPLFSDPLGRPV